jgi:hypothetical protein
MVTWIAGCTLLALHLAADYKQPHIQIQTRFRDHDTDYHIQLYPLHPLARPATNMAKLPLQPRSRKHRQNTTVAATSLRRSRRIAYKSIFPFNNLAPELRNRVYSMALYTEDSLDLTGKLTKTAKALSQVSHSVRAESMGIYYSENTFHAYLKRWWTRIGWRRWPIWEKEFRRIEEWAMLFGELAGPHLTTLRIENGFAHLLTHHIGFIDFLTPLQPVTWTGQRYGDFDVKDAIKAELETFALAILRPQGEVVRTATTLRLFLLGMQVIVEQRTGHRHIDPVPMPTKSPSLDSRAELRKYLPNVKW